MKKKLIVILFLLCFMFLASCNTSRPSAYLSSIEENLRRETFVIEFNTNGGNFVEDVKVKGGTTLEAPLSPTKEHAEFEGWYSNEELTTKYDFDKPVLSNMTLYAKWVSYYRVTFVTIGGSNVEDQYVKDGSKAEYKETTMEGHEFLGWYLDSEYTNEFDFSTPITKEILLFARWS